MNSPQTIDVSSWEDCEHCFRVIEEQHAKSLPRVWYRGLEDATWQLATTLERHCKEPFYVHQYYHLMRKTLPEVESFTGNRWPS
jgi:hypothetical protein